MERLFTPVDFMGKLILWDHLTVTDAPFDGFYHWHPCCEILFVHEGEGTVIFNQHAYEIKRGMLYVFPPFQLHKVYPNVSKERPYARSRLHFLHDELSERLALFPQRNELMVQLCEGQGIGLAYDLSEEMVELEQRALRHQQEVHGDQYEEESLLFLLQLLGILHKKISHPQGLYIPTTNEHDHRPLLYSEKIMKWIEAHYFEEASLEQIAQELHLSKFYVSRVFRQETGSSITDYLTARRIKQACRLLQTTTLSVEQIGIEVGLPDASYFVQLFKKVIGTTPLKYRNQ